jgi:hypothetical protein
MTYNLYIGWQLIPRQGTFPSPSAVALELGNVGNKKRYMKSGKESRPMIHKK